MVEILDNSFHVPIHEIDSIANHTHADRHHGEGHSGSTIFFIFVSCLYGALTRSLVKETNIPFTVIIFILGCALGILSVLVEEVSQYTLLAEIDPHLMLHVFLPVLVFESAYALETHTLIKSFAQVVVLAVPCLLLNAALTGVLVKYLFPYNWSWAISLAFGTIISATDPVAVVSTLKELGTDKKLAILLEGESLLNDGAALVFFTVFLRMARGEYEEGDSGTGGMIVIFFLRVLFGGVALGYVMGKICSSWLAKIFNDAVIETIITIAFPYITYFIAEAVLGVSGVLAVVVLGAILSSEKTSISPEVEKFLHSQWGLLAFASNTLIFTLVGIVISEQGIKELSDNSSYSIMNWFYMAVLYLGITVIRGISLLVFAPILRLLGYGFDWSKGIVMWWGALRGAVSLALALLVAQDDVLDPHTVGNQFLMYSAGIVVLTLVINGCTMRLLLQILGFTKISVAKKMAMTAAVKALEETQKATVAVLKSDRFLADAHWDVVLLMSEIKNPYADRMIKETANKAREVAVMEPINNSHNQMVCPDCSSTIKVDLTATQYKEYEEEARIRYLKAQKVSYWRQFEHGLLGRAAVRKLLELTEIKADKAGTYISLDDIKASWKMRGIYRLFPKISKCLTKLCNALLAKPIPRNLKSTLMFGVTVSTSLHVAVVLFIILQTLAGIIDILMVTHRIDYHVVFLVIALNFTIFFAAELTVKVIGLGLRGFFSRVWNIMAIFTFIAAYPELYAGYEAEVLTLAGDIEGAREYHFMSAAIRIARGIRLLEFFLDTCLPAMLKAVERRIESQINFGYDVGRGFVVGEEECRQLLDHIVEHSGMRDKFKNRCDQMRLAVIKELALLQKSNPGVAVAVKTRQATRTVLNKIIETLDKLKEDGLLDEMEADRLHTNTDKLIKLLVSAPPSVPLMPAEYMLSFVPWLQGVDPSIAKFMQQRAQLTNLDYGDVILQSGEAPKGIYIIVSGLVKIFGRQRLHSHYTTDITDTTSPDYMMVTADRYTDYLGAGAVLGEMGPLMDSQITATATAETAVQLYFLNIIDLEVAFDMYPEVKLKLWKTCAIKIVLNLLVENPEFQTIPKEAAMAYLDHGHIPHICEQTVFNLDDNIAYAFLIHGRVRVHDRPDLELVGPTFIPSSIRVLHFNDPQETILYLVPGEEIPLSVMDSYHEGIRNKLRSFASSMGRKLLKTAQSEQPAKRPRPTLFGLINMLRMKKLLNRTTTQKLADDIPDKPVSESTVDDKVAVKAIRSGEPSNLVPASESKKSKKKKSKKSKVKAERTTPDVDQKRVTTHKAASAPALRDVRSGLDRDYASEIPVTVNLPVSRSRSKKTKHRLLPDGKPKTVHREFCLDTNKPSKNNSKMMNRYSRHSGDPVMVDTEDMKPQMGELKDTTKVVITVESPSRDKQVSDVAINVTISPARNTTPHRSVSDQPANKSPARHNSAGEVQLRLVRSDQLPTSDLPNISEKTESTHKSRTTFSHPEGGLTDNPQTDKDKLNQSSPVKQAWVTSENMPQAVQSTHPVVNVEPNVSKQKIERSRSEPGKNSASPVIEWRDAKSIHQQAEKGEKNPISRTDQPNLMSGRQKSTENERNSEDNAQRSSSFNDLLNAVFSENVNNSASITRAARTSSHPRLHKTGSALLRPVSRITISDPSATDATTSNSQNVAFSSVACKHKHINRHYIVCNVTSRLIEVHHCKGEEHQCDVPQVNRDIERALSNAKLDQ